MFIKCHKYSNNSLSAHIESMLVIVIVMYNACALYIHGNNAHTKHPIRASVIKLKGLTIKRAYSYWRLPPVKPLCNYIYHRRLSP